MAVVPLDNLPKKTREQFQKAASAMERDNLDYAIDMFAEILELEPKLLEARKMIRAAELKKLGEKRGSELSHMLASLTGMGTMMAVNSNLRKKPHKAVIAAEHLLRRDPLNKSFLMAHARACMAADLAEAAIHSLELAADAYPSDVAILDELARTYSSIGMTTQAKETYEKIVMLKPSDPKALKNMKDAAARDTMNKGGWEDAAASGKDGYRKVMKDAEEAKRLEQSAKAVKSTRDVSELIEETRSKIVQEPENINYRRSLADLLSRDNRIEEALEVMEEAQRMTGGGDPQVDRAISQLHVKRFDREIALCIKKGDDAGAKAKEREKDAFLLTDAEERVKRYPNDLQFKYEYGVLLFEHDSMNEAIQQFQQSQRNPQRRNRSLFYLALCFKSKKQYDIAAEQLKRAASEMSGMDDSKKDVLYELGLIYEVMGDHEQATKYFKEIYAVDIGYKEVAKKIEKAYSR